MSIDMLVLRRVEQGVPWAFTLWEPTSVMVVMGRGGDLQKEVRLDVCHGDRVPVFRRRTGGGTVVLGPGMVVFSLGRIVEKPLIIKEYQIAINSMLVDFLDELGISPVAVRGISDLCIGDKKILGSGMFRRQKLLFFQGSLLVSPDLTLMDRYLKHPPREPGYRRGRPHDSFVTTLLREGWTLSPKEILLSLRRHLEKHLPGIQ